MLIDPMMLIDPKLPSLRIPGFLDPSKNVWTILDP